jgi:hypothetical protein
MTFRIETGARGKLTVFTLCGRFQGPAIAELKRLLELHTDRHGIVLDLKDIRVVDREMMRFLARSEGDGVRLENCPGYVREWMEREKD